MLPGCFTHQSIVSAISTCAHRNTKPRKYYTIMQASGQLQPRRCCSQMTSLWPAYRISKTDMSVNTKWINIEGRLIASSKEWYREWSLPCVCIHLRSCVSFQKWSWTSRYELKLNTQGCKAPKIPNVTGRCDLAGPNLIPMRSNTGLEDGQSKLQGLSPCIRLNLGAQGLVVRD